MLAYRKKKKKWMNGSLHKVLLLCERVWWWWVLRLARNRNSVKKRHNKWTHATTKNKTSSTTKMVIWRVIIFTSRPAGARWTVSIYWFMKMNQITSIEIQWFSRVIRWFYDEFQFGLDVILPSVKCAHTVCHHRRCRRRLRWHCSRSSVYCMIPALFNKQSTEKFLSG